MQAIIMAAGYGSRLGDLTKGQPKSFVEIEGKKLLDINLNMLRKHGIKEIVLVTGYRAELFEQLLGSDKDIHLVHNPFFEYTNVLGSFFVGMTYLDEDFVFLHADTICDPSILEDILTSEESAILPVELGECDEEAMKVYCEGCLVQSISKSIPLDVCNGEFIGIAKFSKSALKLLQDATAELMQEGFCKEYFEAAIQRAIDSKGLSAQIAPTKGRFWAEIDFPEDYQNAVNLISKELLDFK